MSIFETDGAWVLVIVSVPILIALVPLIAPSRVATAVSAVLLWMCCVVGLFSVGIFFVPSAVLMTIAAVRATRAAGGPSPGGPSPPV